MDFYKLVPEEKSKLDFPPKNVWKEGRIVNGDELQSPSKR
jgi:hypothetical protein